MHIARLIRERGADGFFRDKCWGLATDDMRKSNQLTACEQWLVKAYHALKHIAELTASGSRAVLRGLFRPLISLSEFGNGLLWRR